MTGYEAGRAWFDHVSEGKIVDLEYTVQVSLRESNRLTHSVPDSELWRQEFYTGVIDAMTEAKWVCVPRSALKGADECEHRRGH